MSNATLEEARAAKAQTREKLTALGVADIVGIGITRIGDSYAVKVNLASKPPPGVPIPSSIDGVPLQIEVTGRPRAYGNA